MHRIPRMTLLINHNHKEQHISSMLLIDSHAQPAGDTECIDIGELQGTEAEFHLHRKYRVRLSGPSQLHNVRHKNSNSNCTYGNFIIRLL